jgi:hypothetical protein
MSEASDTEQAEATIYVEIRKPGMKALDGRVVEVGEIISHKDLGMKAKNLPAAHRRGSIAVKDQATFDAFKTTGRKDPNVTNALLDPDSPIIYGLRGMPDHLKPDVVGGNESDYGEQIPTPNNDPHLHQTEDATPAGHEVAIPEEALVPRAPGPMPNLDAVAVDEITDTPPPPPESPGTVVTGTAVPLELGANAATINVPDEPLRDGMNVKEYWEKAPEDPKRRNGRLCYHCNEPVYPKSALWEHCPDKSLNK